MARRLGKWVFACATILWLANNSPGSQGKSDDTVTLHSRIGNAEYLLSQCKNVDSVNLSRKTVPLKDAPEVMMCFGYISGIIDLEDFNHATLPTSSSHVWCLPDGASNSELAKVMVKYGNDHPEELHLPSVVLVTNALLKAFPCG